MASSSSTATILCTLIVALLIGALTYLYNLFWVKPERLRKKLKEQGIIGPKPSFFFGNISDIKKLQVETAARKKTQSSHKNIVHHQSLSDLFPHIDKWRNDYGSTYTFTLGSMVIVCSSDIGFVKEFCYNKSTEFGRSSYLKNSRGTLLGEDSIITAKGTSWVNQRKIIHPEFFPEKVKGMVEEMIESATHMVARWEAKVNEGGGIATVQVDKDLRNLSAQVISKTCFGNNYARGMEIFGKMLTIMDLLSKQYAFVGLPGFRYIPIKSNRDVWKLGKEIESSILNLMGDGNSTSPANLLEVLTKNINGSGSRDSPLIVDNCKAIFSGGYETTSTTLAFALVLLAHHTDWQNRARSEVLEILQDHQIPTSDMLKKMKTLNMVIHETVRLYPPGPFVTRETSEDMKLGKFQIPKGVNIWIPLLTLHRDPDIWGDDANEFNPERFLNGISGASNFPKIFIPFGAGIRTCVGQNYAVQELKIALSLILSKFIFNLAKEYQHSVAYKLFFRLENAVYLRLERI